MCKKTHEIKAVKSVRVGFAGSVKNHRPRFLSPPLAHFNTLAQDTNTNKKDQTQETAKRRVAKAKERHAHGSICSFHVGFTETECHALWSSRKFTLRIV